LEKDLEILVLRQQLSILQRKTNAPIKPNRVEKYTLSVLTVKLKTISTKPQANSRVWFAFFNLRPIYIGIIKLFIRKGLFNVRRKRV
jgi:hypothetical protein